MEKRILALDQATKTTGYAIFVEGELISVNKFTLSQSEISQRLVAFRYKIQQLIEDNDINFVLFEEIQLQENVDTFKRLAMVYGVLLETIAEMGIEYDIVSSNTWKSKCGIRKSIRKQEKKDAQAFVHQTYGMSVTEDESDAVCIGHSYVAGSRKTMDWSI